MRWCTVLIILLICSAACVSAKQKPIEHMTIMLKPTDPEPVDFYLALPDDYDPAKRYPLLYAVPGSGMNGGTVEKNQAINYVAMFANREQSRNYIVYSIWFTNKNTTYPHWESPRAVVASEMVCDYILSHYSIDRNRVFMQFFSGGGSYAKAYPLQAYANKSPFVLAGLLFTSANMYGGRASGACLDNNTRIFVEVGEKECPEEGFSVDLHTQAHNWENLFKAKVEYTEFHKIPDQEHVISEPAHLLIQEYFKASATAIDERLIVKIKQNQKRAQQAISRKRYGQALTLLDGASGLNSDSAELESVIKAARLIDGVLIKLKQTYLDKIEEDKEAAFGALFVIDAVFKGHPEAVWAGQTALTAYKDQALRRAVSIAKGKSQELIQQTNEELANALVQLEEKP